MFLFSLLTCQKELMSHYAVPQITPGEKNPPAHLRQLSVGDPLPLEKSYSD